MPPPALPRLHAAAGPPPTGIPPANWPPPFDEVNNMDIMLHGGGRLDNIWSVLLHASQTLAAKFGVIRRVQLSPLCSRRHPNGLPT